MLSHKNLTWTADIAEKLLALAPTDCVVSYLPLSHIAEQLFTIHCAVTAGYSVYYAESLAKLADNLKDVQPTLFFAVPRIWEKFMAGISSKLEQAKGIKKAIAKEALQVGREVSALKCAGSAPSGLLALRHRLANRLVYAKLKPALGLGRARICMSGAAPIGRDVIEFFSALDIIVLEVYGQSEDTGPTSFNTPGHTRFGTVGPVLPGVEVKLADDGEILVRGPNVFLGYFKDPAATAETLVDGWLHSGDLGQFDKDGFLSISGRKKEIIITAGGKNITPKNIEEAIKADPLVSEAVLIGDRRKYLTVLVTLEPEFAKRFASEHGADGKPVHELDVIEQQLQKTIDKVNATLARVEQVKKFRVLPRLFTLEDGEVTPSLKLKRRVIEDHFRDVIESMYRE
jgi:long-chain acyl-CoA synthetase